MYLFKMLAYSFRRVRIVLHLDRIPDDAVNVDNDWKLRKMLASENRLANSIDQDDAGPSQRKLAQSLLRFTPQQGLCESSIPGIKLFRCDEKLKREPCVYEPCVVIVIQGRKRGYFGSRTIEYTPEGYVVFSVPIAMESEILEASSDKPFLGLGLTIEPALVTDIQLQIDDENFTEPSSPQSVSVSRLDGPFKAVLERLFAILDNPMDCKILGPMIKRELFYRVLLGSQGSILRAAAHGQNQYHRISQLLKKLHEDCSVSLNTGEMAKMANMSKTALHENFRAITSMSPLQYIKSIRLHQARALMLNDGVNASVAAYQVGYTSPSQFSREYKRLFGRPPSSENLVNVATQV